MTPQSDWDEGLFLSLKQLCMEQPPLPGAGLTEPEPWGHCCCWAKPDREATMCRVSGAHRREAPATPQAGWGSRRMQPSKVWDEDSEFITI